MGTQHQETMTHAVLPDALGHLPEIRQRLAGKRPVFFIDYDGTITPIAPRPELAALSEGMREILDRLARRYTVAVVSGRDRVDLDRRVGLDTVYLAGSHGFDISGPHQMAFEHPQGQAFRPALNQAGLELQERLASVPGVILEHKKYALAVHYRLAPAEAEPQIMAAVDAVLARHRELTQLQGKQILELRPNIDWNKGKAVLWLMDALHQSPAEAVAIYLGDDRTDEDAFREIKPIGGVGIGVGPMPTDTQAQYGLALVDAVGQFLTCFLTDPA